MASNTHSEPAVSVSAYDDDANDMIKANLFTRDWKLMGTAPPGSPIEPHASGSGVTDHFVMFYEEQLGQSDDEGADSSDHGSTLHPLILDRNTVENIEVIPISKMSLGSYHEYFSRCVAPEHGDELINICRSGKKSPVFDIRDCYLVKPVSGKKQRNSILPNVSVAKVGSVDCVPLVPTSIIFNIMDSLVELGINTMPDIHDSFAFSGSRLIKNTLASNNLLSEEDYYKMSTGGDDDYKRLQQSVSSDIFAQVSAYFKSNTGPTIERNEALFDRLNDEMRELAIVLNMNRIKLMFTKVNEPPGTSKPAYFNQRTNYNAVHTPSKKQTIGFADDDAPDENAESTTQPSETTPGPSASVPCTPVRLPTSHTHRVSSMTSKYTPSAAGQSSATKRSMLGFADDSDDSNNDNDGDDDNNADKDFNTTLTADEIQDLSYVSDFIDPASDNYSVSPAVREFVSEAIRNKKAESPSAKEIVTVIRESRSDSKLRSVVNALGMEDDIIDMSSPVMQWIL
ncbi:hypothetical protein NHJ13051_008329, partial [Beauveria bassiana]